MKRNRGITLVALIITIIVLLILAVVAIGAIRGDGIIAHAQNAKEEYTKAQEKEQDLLLKYEYDLEKQQGILTESFGEYAKYNELNKKIAGLKVGDKVNYTATGTDYVGNWKVLGIENNQILLLGDTTIEYDGTFTRK